MYTIKTSSSMKTSAISFKIGEEFEEDRADGKKVKTVVTKESDTKLVQVQKGDKEVTIVREFSDDGLTVVSDHFFFFSSFLFTISLLSSYFLNQTATVNGVTSVRYYKRQ